MSDQTVQNQKSSRASVRRSRLRHGKWSVIWSNLARSRRNVIMSSVGILVGISALVFFIGLGEGIKKVVLGKIFIVDQVEVIPPKVSTTDNSRATIANLIKVADRVFGTNLEERVDLSWLNFNTISDEMDFDLIDGVESAYPKMKFTFPASGYGGKNLLGKEIFGEIIADGISTDFVADELGPNSPFIDREARNACETDQQCDIGMTCGEDKRCVPLRCEPVEPRLQRHFENDPCPGESYCVADLNQCVRPIPVLLNSRIIELYNSGLSIAFSDLPKIGESALINRHFYLQLNRSFLRRTLRGKRRKRKRGGQARGQSGRDAFALRRVKIVGLSDKAIDLGITLPIDYVKRFNRRFTSESAANHYHSTILKVSDQRHFPEIVEEVKGRGLTLADKTENAVQAARVILSIEAVFTLISLVIVAIASLNISQLFFMLITQRRREIGLLRALGATPRDIRAITLGEAAVIGGIGGSAGVLIGWLASLGIDMLVAQLPRFPYKPDSLFVFPWWTPIAGVGVAVIFCVFGAYFPGREAANQEPAEALTQ